MNATVRVYFHSSSKKYNRVECWGPLKDAAKVAHNYNNIIFYSFVLKKHSGFSTWIKNENEISRLNLLDKMPLFYSILCAKLTSSRVFV